MHQHQPDFKNGSLPATRHDPKKFYSKGSTVGRNTRARSSSVQKGLPRMESHKNVLKNSDNNFKVASRQQKNLLAPTRVSTNT